MGRTMYLTHEFAEKTSVSVRTLHYYDKQGILSPSGHTPAGYRLYSDDDLIRLQHILALKYLGFPLSDIKALIRDGPRQFPAALQAQKAMLLEKRAQLDAVIHAIGEAEKLAEGGLTDYGSVVRIMEAMQVELKPEWMNKYLTHDERQTMREIAARSFSPEALKKMAGQPYTEETHRQYAHFRDELRRLTAEGADPGGPEGQRLARYLTGLNARRSQGDPEIAAGMKRSWEGFNTLPEDKKPQLYRLSEEEREFIRRACAILFSRKGG